MLCVHSFDFCNFTIIHPLSRKRENPIKMYTKEFDIRWSDIDANRHLANSAYVNFMSHTRMGFMIENGLSQKEMVVHNIGPVVFHEQLFFFKEAFQGKPITVTFELGGLVKMGCSLSSSITFTTIKAEISLAEVCKVAG